MELDMRGCNAGDKLASQQVREAPAKEAWWNEEIKFEIERLKAILRDTTVTDEEKAIAQSQIANYQETSVMAAGLHAGSLRQM
jgi:hypothetical protein